MFNFMDGSGINETESNIMAKVLVNKQEGEYNSRAYRILKSKGVKAKTAVTSIIKADCNDGRIAIKVDNVDVDTVWKWLYRGHRVDISGQAIKDNVADNYSVSNVLTMIEYNNNIQMFQEYREKITKRFVLGKLTKLIAFFLDDVANQEFSLIWQKSRAQATLYISTRPIDFIRMSHGNAWGSCHDTRVCGYTYTAGATGLAVSESQAIAYVESSNLLELQWRVTLSVNETGYTISRQYPSNNEGYTDAIKKYMDTVYQGELFACDTEELNTGYKYGGYNDGVYQAWFTDEFYKASDNMRYGAMSVCLSCGDSFEYGSESLCCPSCTEPVNHCEHCGENTHGDLTLVHNRRGHEQYVCESCLDNYYTYCDDCNEYYHSDNMHTLPNYNSICQGCFEADYTYCELCEEVIRQDDSRYHDDITYCEHCFNEEFTECAECGEVVKNENITVINNVEYCENCIPDEEEEEEEGETE